MRVVKKVYLEIVLVEESDQVGGGELNVFDLVLEGEGGYEKRLVFFLLDGGVTVEYDLFYSQYKHHFL